MSLSRLKADWYDPSTFTQCDGKKPCKHSATRVKLSLCIYEVHIKLAKCELVKQIKELQARNRVLEQILGALSEDEEVPEILKRLKHHHAYYSIIE
jgi:hypothetical protein